MRRSILNTPTTYVFGKVGDSHICLSDQLFCQRPTPVSKRLAKGADQRNNTRSTSARGKNTPHGETSYHILLLGTRVCAPQMYQQELPRYRYNICPSQTDMPSKESKNRTKYRMREKHKVAFQSSKAHRLSSPIPIYTVQSAVLRRQQQYSTVDDIFQQ